MNFKSSTIQYYRFKQRLIALNERERIILLASSVFFILFLWYFLIFRAQMQYITDTKLNIQAQDTETNTFIQKKATIENLVRLPDTTAKMIYYHQLTRKLQDIEARFKNPQNQRVMHIKDLSNVMRDILKEVTDVQVEDFSTVMVVNKPPEAPLNPEPPALAATTAPNNASQVPFHDSLTLEPQHYQLKLKGSYFSIMNYLKRLEALSWKLYWNTFDYQVLKYPEGKALINFYTLKPRPPAFKSYKAGI